MKILRNLVYLMIASSILSFGGVNAVKYLNLSGTVKKSATVIGEVTRYTYSPQKVYQSQSKDTLSGDDRATAVRVSTPGYLMVSEWKKLETGKTVTFDDANSTCVEKYYLEIKTNRALLTNAKWKGTWYYDDVQ